MDQSDPRRLASLLLYGGPDTRQRLAEQLAADGAAPWSLLAETARSREPWLLRARCLELLGLAAARADQQTAEFILGSLLREAALPDP